MVGIAQNTKEVLCAKSRFKQILGNLQNIIRWLSACGNSIKANPQPQEWSQSNPAAAG
jgi:hypothetical protein